MNKKNNNRTRFATLTLALVAMVYSGCNEKNLDLKPLAPTEEDYFDEQGDFERTALGIYAKMTDIYAFNGGRYPGENQHSPSVAVFQLPGDDMTTTGTGNAATDFETFGSINSSNDRSENMYRNMYLVISRANVLLEKIDEVEDGVYQDSDLKNYHRGEALFLRGLMNYYLWNLFGTSPIVTERIKEVSDALVGPSEGTQLLDQAIADLQEASSLLPDRDGWGALNLGRATRNAAFGMLGKSLVYRGTVTGSTGDFTAALNAFDQIFGAQLVEDFGDNFAANTENNLESLFEFQAGQDPGENIWLPNDFQGVVKDMSVASWIGFTDTNSWAYGLGRFVATAKLASAFHPEDPRLELTLDPETRYIQKYVLRDQTVLGGASSVNNPRILRYADVLLLKAEALLRSGGNKADAVALINEVRTRARNMSDTGFPENYNTAETDVNTIMAWLRNERFLELAFEEGNRWFDLRRWHMAGEIELTNSFFSSDNTGFSFDASKHLYFPIPQSELNSNIEMRQNEGY